MNNKVVSILVIIVLIAGGVLLFMGRTVAPTDIDSQIEAELNESEGEVVDNEMPVPGDEGENVSEQVVEFTIDGSNFEFLPSVMTVKKGDTIRITFNNTGGTHDFKIDEFEVDTGITQTGDSRTVEFVASEVGTFQYYCSVGSHRAMGMVGSLTVEE